MFRPFREISDFTIVCAVVCAHLTVIAARNLAQVPGDIWHGGCHRNAGPRCPHQDCPHTQCHPGLHDLEARHARVTAA